MVADGLNPHLLRAATWRRPNGLENRRAKTDLGLPAGDDVDTLAAILVRLAHSLVVIPDGPPDLTRPEQLQTFARTTILPPNVVAAN